MSDDPSRRPLDPGSASGHGHQAHAPETEHFDREINVRGIVLTGAVLAVVILLAHLLMWWLLKGFERYDEKRDVRLSPVEAANPQPPPAAPVLQENPVKDMTEMRAKEDQELDHAAWIDRRQDVLRLPVADAIDIVAVRGVAPEVVGGRTGAPVTTDSAGTTATKPGATVQNALPATPAKPAQPAPGGKKVP
ncbi:MAG TPA: hypothetical protein VIA62_10525 [Thermoanaerobaculia bacterium]|jgi:hypothetical protein|nr:hypothetical protein [Thermoanaerobaculia bacterium]